MDNETHVFPFSCFHVSNIPPITFSSLSVIPTITIAPENQTLSSGTHVTLECQAEGHPKPTVSWLRDGHVLGLTNRISMSDDNTAINIEHVKESDAGKAQTLHKNRSDPL